MFNFRELYCENCRTKNHDYLDDDGNIECVCSFCKCSVRAKFKNDLDICINSRNDFFRRLTFNGLFCANCGQMHKGKLSANNDLILTCSNDQCARSVKIRYANNNSNTKKFEIILNTLEELWT